MAAICEVGQFNIGTSTGSLTVNSTRQDSGLTWKAVYAFASKRTTAGSQDTLYIATGCATGPADRWATWVGSLDAATTSNVDRQARNDAFLIMRDPSGDANNGLADFTSFNSGTKGFTINRTTAFTADYMWTYLLIGDDDGSITAGCFADNYPSGTGTTTQNVNIHTAGYSGTAFQPSAVMWSTVQTDLGTITTNMGFQLAFATDTGHQGVVEIEANTAEATASFCKRIARSDRVVCNVTTDGSTTHEASFNGMIANGYSLSWTKRSTSRTDDLYGLAIKGAYVFVDSFTVTSGSANPFVRTGYGMAPVGLIMAGHCTSESAASTSQNDSEMTISVASANPAKQACLWATDLHGLATEDSANNHDTSNFYADKSLSAGVVSADGTLGAVTFTSDGWSAPLTAPSSDRWCVLLAIGNAAPPAPIPQAYTEDVLAIAGPIPPLAFVLEIEGYDTLLTSWQDTAAVLDAYGDTEHTAAICCLYPPGSYRQGIRPWLPKLEGGTTTFTVYPRSDTDVFGEALWSSVLATGKEGFLQADIDSNDLALTLDDADEFAASGSLYLGIERATYTSRDTGTEVFTLSERGKFAPWKANTETLPRFGRPHRLGTVQTARQKPMVTDYPAIWEGKTVRLSVHFVRGGVLNERAYALKWFAGRIADIDEEPDGRIVLSCTDAVEMVGSAVVFREQWRAKVQEGLFVTQDWTSLIRVTEVYNQAPSGTDSGASTALVVVPSGASAPGEINEGYYTVDEICSFLNAYLAGEIAAARIIYDWHLGTTWTKDGWRTRVSAAVQTALGGDGSVATYSLFLPDAMAEFLGGFQSSAAVGGVREIIKTVEDGDTGVVLERLSESEPLRVAIPTVEVVGSGQLVNVEGAQGVWMNQTAYLPERLAGYPSSPSENWGVVRIGSDNYAMAKYQDDSTLYLRWVDQLALFGGTGEGTSGVRDIPKLRYGDAGDLEVAQVLMLQSEFKALIMALICSTGTVGYNHATWDALPYGMGAGIPYELLGDGFEATVDQMSAMTGDESITMLITRRTQLAELLLPEMTLRNAHLVWIAGDSDTHTGGLRFITPQIPDPTTAPYALTELNKPDKPGRIRPRRSLDLLINAIDVKYGYRLDGSYAFGFPLANSASITNHGITSPLTLYARNTFGASSQLGDALRNLVSEIAGYVLTIFARPVIVAERGYTSELISLHPGAGLSLSDSHLRAAIGGRGVTNLPCWALTTTWDWGSSPPRGSLELVIISHEDANRRTQYSPCARVDETQANGGYNSGTSTLTLVEHEHSWPSENGDGLNFHDNDLITILSYGEFGGSVESWDRTVSGTPTGTSLIFTGGALTAWTATKKHRIVSRTYASAVAAQQTKTYLGDATDGKINGSLVNRRWSADSLGQSEQLPVLPTVQVRQEPIWSSGVDMMAEGMPVNPGVHAALSKSLDNQISYKSAPHFPMQPGDSDCLYTQSLGIAGIWYGMILYPVAVGKGDFPSRWKRRIRIAPQFWRSSGSGTIACRITSMRTPPTGAQWFGAVLTPPIKSVTFTTTSTTIQISTRQTLDLVMDQDRGVTLLYVEFSTDNGGDAVSFTGIAEGWLGPLE